MVLKNNDDYNTLLGMSFFGGGKKTKKPSAKKVVRRRMRGGEDETSLYCKCSTVDSKPVSSLVQSIPVTAPVQVADPIAQLDKLEKLDSVIEQSGGKYLNDKKKMYKKRLETYTKDKLLIMAKNNNIKVTQKINNVSSVVKKETLVKKLVAKSFN